MSLTTLGTGLPPAGGARILRTSLFLTRSTPSLDGQGRNLDFLRPLLRREHKPGKDLGLYPFERLHRIQKSRSAEAAFPRDFMRLMHGPQTPSTINSIEYRGTLDGASLTEPGKEFQNVGAEWLNAWEPKFVFILTTDRRDLVADRSERDEVALSVEEGRNSGCDLFYTTNVIFTYKTIAFYSQRLVFNTLEDVKRLLDNLKTFSTGCCLFPPDLECFFSSKIILENRICKDQVSMSKNRQAALCCDQDYLERERCFQNLQNNPPLLLPSIGEHISYEEECLAWAANSHAFMESYLHGFSRRLTKFTPALTSDIFHSFLIIYMKCCDSEDMNSCFSTEKKAFSESMRTKIRLDNTMCLMNKRWEGGLRPFIFYVKMRPGDMIDKAVMFDRSYMALASQCCKPEAMTSECFETWSDVLLTRICLLMKNSSQKICCLKSNPERESCLTELAYQESKTIPTLSLEPRRICNFNSNSELLQWVAYEHSRRDPKGSIMDHHIFATNVKTFVDKCCKAIDQHLCLTSFYKYFPM
ncbi:albumin-like [Pelodytes ibericus]